MWSCYHKSLKTEIKQVNKAKYRISLNDKISTSICTIERAIEEKKIGGKDCLIATVGIDMGDSCNCYNFKAYSDRGLYFSEHDIPYLATRILFFLLKSVNRYDKNYMARIDKLKHVYLEKLAG